jgi:hypothetical protein
MSLVTWRASSAEAPHQVDDTRLHWLHSEVITAEAPFLSRETSQQPLHSHGSSLNKTSSHDLSTSTRSAKATSSRFRVCCCFCCRDWYHNHSGQPPSLPLLRGPRQTQLYDLPAHHNPHPPRPPPGRERERTISSFDPGECIRATYTKAGSQSYQVS